MNTNWQKNAAVFLAGQTISILGSSLVQYAIMWHITLTTQSGVYAAISIFCGFLPAFILSPFAGVWADRYNRKHLIIIADALIALATLILAVIFLSGYSPMWLLFVVSAIRSFGSAVQNPCVGAILPSIVPQEKLTRVNSINGTLQSITTLISPMISGALLGFATIEIIMFIDVVTAAIAIGIMIFFLTVPYTKKSAEEIENTNYIKELKLGLKYIGDNKYLKNFFIILAFTYILISPACFLTPLQVTRNYGDDVWRLTAIEMLFSVGMMSGGILLAIWGGFKNRIHTICFATLAFTICIIGLGLPINFIVYMVIMFIMGTSLAILNTPSMVLLQERVDPSYMGRVFSIMAMISTSLMPMGMLFYGPLADVIKIDWMLIVTGICMLFVILAMFTNKALIKAGIKEKEDQNAEIY